MDIPKRPVWMLLLALTMGSLTLFNPASADQGGQTVLPQIEGFPSQPIRLIVYTSPGGLIDVTARRFARLAQEYADHPVAVINRPGGGGIVAFEEALREPADGHRFLAVTRSNISKMVASGREDLIDRIHWHSYIMDNAHVLITNSDGGPADYESLRQITHNGQDHQLWLGVDIGGVKHISGAKMADKAGFNMRWIPYGSGGEARAALLGNLGHAYLGNPRDALASDKLRVVAVAAEQRLPAFPDAPTFAELGINGLEDELIWRGFAFRQEVPDDIRHWYDVLINLVINDERWLASWENEAVNLRFRNAEQFATIVERDRAEFRTYLDRLGLLPGTNGNLNTLESLVNGPGLFGVLGLSGLLLLGLVVGLPRTPWHQRRGELIMLASISLLGLIAWLISTQMPGANLVDPVGTSGIPRLWMVLLIPLALWQIAQCLREQPQAAEARNTARLLASLALFIAYLLVIPVFGYLLASALYMPALIWFLGYRRISVIAAVTITWLLFSEFVFQRLLHVDLPAGIWL